MGNKNSGSSLDRATQRVEQRVGRISIEGRYHRLPARLEDHYEVEKKALGSGYNGAVLLARNKETRQKVAVKAFKLHGVSKEKKKELVTEAEIFLGMDHPHVARLVDVYENEEALSLVMECMEGGELFDRVTERKIFSEKDAAGAAWQMLLAVNYIHSCGVVHRDLKLENFLYERKDTDFLKLIDFGFSKIWEKNTKMELSCGTLSYVAPEVLGKSYTSQCDLWSLGVIVFILLVGYMPFSGSSERQQVSAIRSGKYNMRKDRWSRVSAAGFDFVQKLLVVDPEVRLNAEQALEHPWVQKQHVSGRQEEMSSDIADALVGFARESQFRRSVMQLMAWSLTAEERAEVRGAFLELDSSKTGIIKLSELKQVLEAKFHVTEDEAAQVFNALDTNHDHEINYSEFLAAMVSSRIALHDDLIKETFRRFDAENAGYITQEALTQILGEDIDVKHVMAQIDQNHDNKISHAEFIAYLRNGNAHASHEDAANRLIDKHLQSADAEPDGSPVRLRKRDKLMMFAKTALGMTRSTSDAPTP